jgi:putative ABC transport system permease protein
LKPKAEDDFAINEMSIITEQFYSFFKILNMVGWIIGGFSLLVGGFGIANIMFVSVKERTKEIGIQMAMGAKRFFILFQFLFEAIFLALFGGVIGLILIFILISVANMVIPFELILTLQNILFGILVSVAIGLFSGLAPAYLASKMDPVDAMRSV